MTASDSRRHDGSPVPRPARKRWIPFVAASTAAVLAGGAIASAGGGAAGAATAPAAQSAGNFLNATLGGNTLDSIAKLAYAQAQAPGSTSVQNPLNATVLSAINADLTGNLNLPQIAGITLGAVNQVANANEDGSSFGASGAVNNTGGVSVNDNNNAYPATSNIDFKASTLSSVGGNSGVTVPGGGTADALGSLTAGVGAVSALASTPKGYGKAASTTYTIADVSLNLGSPLLGGLLGNVTSSLSTALGGVLTTVTGLLTGAGFTLPAGCALTTPSALTQTISLEQGAITIDPSTATITVSLKKLLGVLGLNIDSLPANTDLISYLLAYLADPNGLAKGLTDLVNGLLNPLQDEFTACASAIQNVPVVGATMWGLVSSLFGTGPGSLTATAESTIGTLVAAIANAGGANPLAPLAGVLQKLIDIGVNVQPNGAAGPTGAAYVDPLEASVKQGTTVVAGQTVVRAIEVNVAGGLGSSLPGLGSLPLLSSLPGLSGLGGQNASERSLTGKAAAANGLLAAAPGSGTGILTLGLGNAAAGPSTAPVTPPASSTAPPSSSVPATTIPTGVPAGQATQHGASMTPLTIVLLLLALTFAGGGVVAFRMRGRIHLH